MTIALPPARQVIVPHWKIKPPPSRPSPPPPRQQQRQQQQQQPARPRAPPPPVVVAQHNQPQHQPQGQPRQYEATQQAQYPHLRAADMHAQQTHAQQMQAQHAQVQAHAHAQAEAQLMQMHQMHLAPHQVQLQHSGQHPNSPLSPSMYQPPFANPQYWAHTPPHSPMDATVQPHQVWGTPPLPTPPGWPPSRQHAVLAAQQAQALQQPSPLQAGYGYPAPPGQYLAEYATPMGPIGVAPGFSGQPYRGQYPSGYGGWAGAGHGLEPYHDQPGYPARGYLAGSGSPMLGPVGGGSHGSHGRGNGSPREPPDGMGGRSPAARHSTMHSAMAVAGGGGEGGGGEDGGGEGGGGEGGAGSDAHIGEGVDAGVAVAAPLSKSKKRRHQRERNSLARMQCLEQEMIQLRVERGRAEAAAAAAEAVAEAVTEAAAGVAAARRGGSDIGATGGDDAVPATGSDIGATGGDDAVPATGSDPDADTSAVGRDRVTEA